MIEIRSGDILGRNSLLSNNKNIYNVKIISTNKRKKILDISTPKGPKARGVKSVIAMPILIVFNKMFLKVSIFVFIVV